MFSEPADLYDLIYAAKDYPGEATRLHEIIQQYKRAPGVRLLDAACGTGVHLQHLKALQYAVEGFDLDAGMLARARERLPDVPFHHADMTNFEFGKTYDVITCLFSAIGYLETDARLHQAAAAFRRHLVKGGVLLVEPWFTPEQFYPNTVHAVYVNQPELKIVRMNVSQVDGKVSLLNFHYMVGTPHGITTFTEALRLRMFTLDEYRAAFESAGFKVTHDPNGLSGRGLFIGEVVD